MGFAIKNGITLDEAGTTTYEAKSEIGFSILPQRMYLWHQNALFIAVAVHVFKTLMDNMIDNCHYAFKSNNHQYLWDGRSQYYIHDSERI